MEIKAFGENVAEYLLKMFIVNFKASFFKAGMFAIAIINVCAASAQDLWAVTRMSFSETSSIIGRKVP